jgi:hypothetical protein
MGAWNTGGMQVEGTKGYESRTWSLLEAESGENRE